MKYAILSLLMLISISCSAQTFYVSGKDPKSVEVVTDRIKFDGYKISVDSTTADYIVEMLLDGHYSPVSLKQPYRGYIKIWNRSTGEEISRTKTIARSPAVLNGYNASYTIFSVITKRYMDDELKKCKKVG